MFKYSYLLCTQPIKNKFSVRKYIFAHDLLYSYEDNKFNSKQIHNLISSLSNSQYNLYENFNLPNPQTDPNLIGIKA